MRTLGTFIEEISPKFNKVMTEGICYHRLNQAVEYIDRFIKYGCQSKTKTHLRYLGYKEVLPKEELKFLFNKASKTEYDIAENDIYLVEFFFQYGESDEIMKHMLYIPYMNKGNVIHLSGNKMLVMPVFADKVISVGEKIIFINILTAKYNITRSYFSVLVNGRYTRVPIINSELYRNPSKKQEDTTKANTTVMHYLLANYGFQETMKLLLGFVPVITYKDTVEGCVVIKSTDQAPQGYIGNKTLYASTAVRFAVENDKYDENVAYVLGNMFYIIDNFPDVLLAQDFDDPIIWKRLLGEIIHSGNHSVSYLAEKINTHFNDLNSRFDNITIDKLADVGVNATTLIELITVIFQRFNMWIMNAAPRSLYHNKTYEVESFALSNLTSRITRIVLDINKEELRMSNVNNGILEDKEVDKIFKKYFKTRAVFSLKKEKLYVASIDYAGDHLYPKNTAMVFQQESNFINVKSGEVNTSERKKIVATMATVGSILGLSKNNPTPVIRLNPYVNVDPVSGTVLPHPFYNNIIEETDKLLSNMVQSDSIDESLLDAVTSDDPESFIDYEDLEVDEDSYEPDDIDID